MAARTTKTTAAKIERVLPELMGPVGILEGERLEAFTIPVGIDTLLALLGATTGEMEGALDGATAGVLVTGVTVVVASATGQELLV
jgi:hypothetical protein